MDPRQIPLPKGTEVTTRVARSFGGQLLPMSALGRVVGEAGERVLVDVVGVGVLDFARDDLLPRKAGQLRFAARRHDAWQALAPTIVLRTTVGSRAWGLADETSDTDERGVFVLPLEWTVGLAPRSDDLVSIDGSAAYWEVEKAIRQALRADPNTLELLFVEGARAEDPMGEWLLAERDAFVSRDIYGSFGRYAVSQLRRLEQASRLAEHRGIVLSWLRREPSLSLDDVALRLATATGLVGADAPRRAKEYVKQLYRSLHDQALLPACDFSSLVAFAATAETTFELSRELRPKNAYNLLRLLFVAHDWLADGAPRFQASGARRDRLLAIKRSEVPLADVLAEAEDLLPGLEALRLSTKLPARPDLIRADRLLSRVRLEAARRSLANESGPWGKDAPRAPVPDWEDP
ncbi:MAG: nucleotidyltransferase domain-containing protein [Myxococcales bacterium]|nr:nucleotidyltransferase domain-containing protein [Myxococcales bacterium]